jgi:HK97 family phage major capsid protein
MKHKYNPQIFNPLEEMATGAFFYDEPPAAAGPDQDPPATDPAVVTMTLEDRDQLLQDIQELTNLIGEHNVLNEGMNTLDVDALTARFQEQIDSLKAHQQDQQLPVRAGLDAGFATDEIIGRVRGIDGGNRYKGMARNIARDGHQKWGGEGWKLTGADLVMAHRLLVRVNQFVDDGHIKRSVTKNLKPVSPDLEAAVLALTGHNDVQKLMESTVAGAGDELVPTGLDAQLWEDFFAASQVVADMPTIPMPTDPFEVPLGLGDPTWRKGTEGIPTSEQNPATAKVTMLSTEQILDIAWTYDLDELAVIAMMPQLRALVSRTGAEQMDAFMINADSTNAATGNINLDDANPPEDAYYLAKGQDGIRHQWLVNNTGQGVNQAAAVSDAGLRSMIAKMGKYALDLENCRIVPEIQTYFAMLGVTNVVTVDKYGLAATVLSGELGRYQGIRVMPSASMPKTEADGKVSATAASNTKGQISAYNKNQWLVGFSRQLLIEVDRDIRSRQLIMVASFKQAMAAHGTRSSAIHTAGMYNITI